MQDSCPLRDPRSRKVMMGDSDEGVATADAFVSFGAMGDLAHKMISPALYQMVKRGTLDVPVIGSRPPTGVCRRFGIIRDSIARTDAGIDEANALDKLLSLLGYVDGDYRDPGTFKAL